MKNGLLPQLVYTRATGYVTIDRHTDDSGTEKMTVRCSNRRIAQDEIIGERKDLPPPPPEAA